MAARYVSSTLIKNINKSGKTIAIEYVDKTTGWVRPAGFPSATVKEEFAAVAEENAERFTAATTKIAVRESEHQSDRDARMHYSAYGLDQENNVVDTQHLVKKK